MARTAPPWFSVATHFKGLTEVHGAVAKPQILEMFRISGQPEIEDDETPWSAAFVSACLRLAGFRSSSGLGARSYQNFGEDLGKEPRRGCIVVLWRGSPAVRSGHVGFFDREDSDNIFVLGSDQGDTVTTAQFPKNRVLAYRWPTEPAPLPTNTTLPNILTIDPANAPDHLRTTPMPSPAGGAAPRPAQDVLTDLLSVLVAGAPQPPEELSKQLRLGLQDRAVELLYATNRKPAFDDSYFCGERNDTTTYGAARIHIPDAHRPGKVELPFKLSLFSLTLYEQELDPAKHFIIQSVTVQSVDDWKASITKSSLRHALVFVHGFNTTFRDSLHRAAQIMWDLQYAGVPILFSWPSRGRILDYGYDRESALLARDAFVELLRNIRMSGVERIHILAHSMGNLVVLDSLASHAHTTDPLGIGEILMAAPDVDKDMYLKSATKVRAAVSGMTLYASAADRAMAASKALAGNVSRAGDVPDGGPILVKGIDAIDVTRIGEELFGLGHSAYSEKASILNDIALIISTGIRPPNRRLPASIKGMPTGADPAEWWVYF
jgi:uncharacterized protein (TIGR02594 family)